MDVLADLKRLVVETSVNPICVEDVTEDINLKDAFDFDSLAIVNLMIEMENCFGIQFNDNDLETVNLYSFKELYKAVLEKMN